MFICKYCKSERKNNRALHNHERRCANNADRISSSGMSGMLGKKGTNQFTKAAKLGLPIPVSSRKGKLGALVEFHHSEETKKILSERRKEYLKLNPDKVPYLLNHSSKTSYPELYFINCFNHLSNVVAQYHISTYHVDFANVTDKLYLEIDGDQHYLDQKMVLHDQKRTKTLNELGWSGIRIRWSEFQKRSDEDKQEYVQQIISEMNWK